MPAVSFTHPMHSLSECRTDAQASRAPGGFGKLTHPGTKSVFQKGHSDPPALHGTIFCSRNTIRFETSTMARTVAGTKPGLLGCDRAEHPTAHGSCSANTDSGTHARCCGYFCVPYVIAVVLLADLNQVLEHHRSPYITQVWATTRTDATPDDLA